VTTNAEDAALSESGSDGVQLIFDNSSENARVLQASSVFRPPGITDPAQNPFLSSPRGGPQRGGRLQRQPKGQQRQNEGNSKSNLHQTQSNIQQPREQQKGVQRRDKEVSTLHIRQSQPNPEPRINERRGSVQSIPNLSLRTTDQREKRRGFPGASSSARLPNPRLPIRSQVWPTPPGLVTTRQSIQHAISIEMEADKEKLIKGHDQDVDIIIYVSK